MTDNKTALFELPPLPYARNALAPVISEETINFHYGKHHQAYVNNLNTMANDPNILPLLKGKTIEELVRTLDAGKPFNNAAQVWNHDFYWKSMAPNGGGEPSGEIAKAITASFGSFEKFKADFSAEAGGHFGSGWAWLVVDAKDSSKKLKVISTHDAGSPISKLDGRGFRPVLTCDVWEHAYYIDFRNVRAEYVAAWWKTINWQFANEQLANALASKM
jgi:Fe-Mn family superoxide dismutase